MKIASLISAGLYLLSVIDNMSALALVFWPQLFKAETKAKYTECPVVEVVGLQIVQHLF